MSPMAARWPKRVAIAAFWLAAWQLAAWAAGSGLLLCGPWEAVQALVRLLPTAPFWECVGGSLARIGVGFAVSAALAVAAGALAARVGLVREVLAPLMSVVKSAPVVCVIALLLVWAGSAQATSIAVGLVVAPPFYAAVVEAAEARSVPLGQALRVLGAGPWRRLALLRWPEAAPFLRAAARTAAGMAWKAGVAAEIIGLPAASIGEQVYLAKLTLDTPSIIAWTATVVALGWLSERLVVALVDAGARAPGRWLSWQVRRAEALLGCEGAAAAPDGQGATSGASGHEGRVGALACGEGLAWPDPAPLRFDAVAKGFGGATVVEGLALEMAPGARVALMAPSGSGKTTLVRLACGLERPDAGTVEAPSLVGVVFQEPRLVEGLAAPENLAMTARSPQQLAYGIALLRELLDGAPGALGKPASQLSGGMRRRVELARALACPAPALLLDEPFAGLDAATRDRTAAIAMANRHGRTLLATTHDPADAALLDAQVVALANL